MKYCRFCGKPLAENQHWCPHCMRRQTEAGVFTGKDIRAAVKRARLLRCLPVLMTVLCIALLTIWQPWNVQDILTNQTSSSFVPPTDKGVSSAATAQAAYTSDAPSSANFINETISSVQETLTSTALSSETITAKIVSKAEPFDITAFTEKISQRLHAMYPQNLYPAARTDNMSVKMVPYRKTWRNDAEASLYAEDYLPLIADAIIDKVFSWYVKPPNQFSHNPDFYVFDYHLTYTASEDTDYLVFEMYYYWRQAHYKTKNFDSDMVIHAFRQKIAAQKTWSDFASERLTPDSAFYVSLVLENSLDLELPRITGNLLGEAYSVYSAFDIRLINIETDTNLASFGLFLK